MFLSHLFPGQCCLHSSSGLPVIGIQSNNNLFPTLAQPVVFEFWPRPDSRIPMQKAYVLKHMVLYNKAFPVIRPLLREYSE